MADELKPRIVRMWDEQRYDQDTGASRVITRVEYKIGNFGPFLYETPKDTFTQFTLQAAIDERVVTLRTFTP